jgi:predicted PurR-regulated permease PerM
MSKFQDMLKDRMFVRYGAFILFTATLLYIIYLVLSNISFLAGITVDALASLSAALAPLIIGLIIAYIINPLVTLVETKVTRRVVRIPDDPDKIGKSNRRVRVISVLMTYLLIVVILLLILYGVASLLLGKLMFNISIPDLYDQTLASILAYQEAINNWVANLPSGMFSEQLDGVVQNVIQWITNNFSAESAMGIVSGVGVSIFNFIIGVMVSIYLSIDKDFFIRLWGNAMTLLLPEKRSVALEKTLTEINGVTSKFMRGVLLDAFIVAVLSSIALMIAGLEFAIFVGIFAGICNVIPYFGPIIGMVPAFIIGFLTDDIWKGLIAIAVLFVIQQVDSSFIYPRVVGSSTGLHPLFVLMAVSIGGYYAGLVGMILAVPIAGIVQIFVRRWAVAKEAAKEAAKEHENKLPKTVSKPKLKKPEAPKS